MSIVQNLRHWRPYDPDRVAFNLTEALARKADDANSWQDQQLQFGWLSRHLNARTIDKMVIGSDRRNKRRAEILAATREALGGGA